MNNRKNMLLYCLTTKEVNMILIKILLDADRLELLDIKLHILRQHKKAK